MMSCTEIEKSREWDVKISEKKCGSSTGNVRQRVLFKLRRWSRQELHRPTCPTSVTSLHLYGVRSLRFVEMCTSSRTQWLRRSLYCRCMQVLVCGAIYRCSFHLQFYWRRFCLGDGNRGALRVIVKIGVGLYKYVYTYLLPYASTAITAHTYCPT